MQSYSGVNLTWLRAQQQTGGPAFGAPAPWAGVRGSLGCGSWCGYRPLLSGLTGRGPRLERDFVVLV